MKHTWDYCSHCRGLIVICGRCGNNCCNAGHGLLEDGSECPDCESAYALWRSGEGKPELSPQQEVLLERLSNCLAEMGPSFCWEGADTTDEAPDTFFVLAQGCYEVVDGVMERGITYWAKDATESIESRLRGRGFEV